MYSSEKQIYLQETEIKPNHAAIVVLVFTLAITVMCWLVNELGIFRVDKNIMRIGSIIVVIAISVPLALLLSNKDRYANPVTKYWLMFTVFMFTMTTSTMLTFHTTIMLLFPISFAMLYRSKNLGKIALAASLFCTIVTPILGYLLGTWDVPLFQELILIATGGNAVIIDPTYQISWLAVGKIVLYIVFPRILMVGACAVLMFRVITIGTDHVQTEILLNRLNNRDALTGLYNQNHYKEYLMAPKDPGMVGVIFFDVNGLKYTNDHFGHERGDLMLKRSAQSIISICDEMSGSAFRLGGDEFLLVIEGATEPVIIQKIAEWKNALELINRENAIEYDGLICSMAAGYAVGQISDLENVVHRADALMYRNKSLMKSNIKAFGSVEEQ